MPLEQFAFDLGAPGRAPAIDRLYFALLPDARGASQALKIAKADFACQEAAGFLYSPGRLHVSIDKRWEGRELPDLAIKDALRRGLSVTFAPFEIRLDQLKSKGNGAIDRGF